MRLLADDERGVKSKRRDEIAGLKLPSRKRAIDDLKSQRQPIRALERSNGIESLRNNRLLQSENDLRFNFQRTRVDERQRGLIVIAVVHGVVVHMSPNQSLKFEHAPHGLVGITNLAADRQMSAGLADSFECSFHVICGVEIEARAGGRRDRNHLPCLSGRQQLMSQTFDFVIVRHERVHLLRFNEASIRRSNMSAPRLLLNYTKRLKEPQ